MSANQACSACGCIQDADARRRANAEWLAEDVTEEYGADECGSCIALDYDSKDMQLYNYCTPRKSRTNDGAVHVLWQTIVICRSFCPPLYQRALLLITPSLRHTVHLYMQSVVADKSIMTKHTRMKS